MTSLLTDRSDTATFIMPFEASALLANGLGVYNPAVTPAVTLVAPCGWSSIGVIARDDDEDADFEIEDDDDFGDEDEFGDEDSELDEDEEEARETGIAQGIRARLFSEVAGATRGFALTRLCEGDEASRRALTAAIARLEQSAGLLRLNLNESAALEHFLLFSLRLWSRR